MFNLVLDTFRVGQSQFLPKSSARCFFSIRGKLSFLDLEENNNKIYFSLFSLFLMFFFSKKKQLKTSFPAEISILVRNLRKQT